MSKILIWRQIIPGSDIDIFSSTDYSQICNRLHEVYDGGVPNWGNKLWFQGIYSEISTAENEVVIRTTETPDEINANFDLVIYPMANFFSPEFCSDTGYLVEQLKRIRIPVYVIACGAQADQYDDLELLVKKIKEPASRFIDAVYQTGGEFALRGFFTKAFFDRLGYPSAVVTGCPSLFQSGRNLKIDNAKKSADDLRLIINGNIHAFEKIMQEKEESTYFAQDGFASELFDPHYFANRNIKRDICFVDSHSIFQAELLSHGRIKMIADMNDWYQYIRRSGFNYSFGTKIHGSIMPILAGIPATVLYIDSRTQEMAEFFDIPYQKFQRNHIYSFEEVIDAYIHADYTLFNKRFSQRFDAFESFLTEHKIVKQINTQNPFFAKAGNTFFDEYQPNKEEFAAYAAHLKMQKPLHSLMKYYYKTRRK